MSRLKLWGFLLVASIVSLVSLMSVLGPRYDSDGNKNWNSDEKWIISVTSISIGLSFFGALASMLPPENSLKLESPLITLSLAMWAAGMPALLNPKNDLAVGEGYVISNANLYFFGWFAMISCICLAGNFAKQINGDEASPVTLKWIMLGATSFIVMATSSAVYSNIDCKKVDTTSEYKQLCARTNFAIWFGCCSAILALLVAYYKNAPFMCHAIVSCLMMAAWCCAVAFLTFGSGPGTVLGNIYFATWTGFFLALNLVTTSVRYALEEHKNKDRKSVV